MTHTHVTAPTQYIEAGGIRFAYRRFGQDKGVPLILMPHYRAGMDHWDPAVTDGLAASRPVILFDNAGIAGSSGKTPHTMEEMATTPPPSSARSDYRSSICLDSRSVVTSRKRSRCATPTWSDASCL